MSDATTQAKRDARLYQQYEVCDVCEGRIDTTLPGYYKSHDDETFHHELCHKHGEAPEGYVFELTDTERPCITHQFNCGHAVRLPQAEKPGVCPECNDLEYAGGEWSVNTRPEPARSPDRTDSNDG